MATITAPRPAHHAPRGYYREAARAGAPILSSGRTSSRVTPAQVRLRRTVAFLILATAALVAVFVLGRTSVHAAPPVAGETTPTSVVYTVAPGDSLWSIATHVAPKTDPRSTIHLIREINGLSSGAVQVGQKLTIPQ